MINNSFRRNTECAPALSDSYRTAETYDPPLSEGSLSLMTETVTPHHETHSQEAWRWSPAGADVAAGNLGVTGCCIPAFLPFSFLVL